MEQSVAELLKPGHLVEASAYWGGKPEDLELLGQVENFVYGLRAAGRDLILRLTHSSHRTPDQVRGELDWMDHLHRHGVNVAAPIRSSNGRFVETVPARGSAFIVTAFERAPGGAVDRNDPSVWNHALFEEWGRTIGRMHAAARTYVPSDPAFGRSEWYEEDLLVNAACYLPPSEGAALENLGRCVRWLGGLSQNPRCYGMVHTDVHTGNFFYHDGRITVFDFDDAAYHWFAYDIAMPLYYALLGFPYEAKEEQAAFCREFFPAFMHGYAHENAIDPDWMAQLPRFLQFRDRLLHVFCFKKFDMANLTEGQERFLNRMRATVGVENAYEHLDFSMQDA